MDPLAHTLVGATLAETGLGRVSRRATLALIVGANLPDIDAIAQLWGRDTSLWVRRGWSHGVLALLVLPWLLAGTLYAIERWRADTGSPKVRFWPLFAVGWLGILTHPALDWLNTYGIRLLMPVDGRWFYGDALFIVDPWVWLTAAAAVVLAHSRSRFSIVRWLVLASLTTWAMFATDLVTDVARVVWLVGLAGIVVTRLRLPPGRTRLAARVTATVLVLYIATMIATARWASGIANAWLRQHGQSATVVMAGPIAANPFVRDVVARSADRYVFLRVDFLADEPVRVGAPSLTIGDAHPAVALARQEPRIAGFVNWARFPIYEVEPTASGWRVVIRDVRFVRRRGDGFGAVEVEVAR